MKRLAKCPRCGRSLPDDAPLKLCPACLIEAALGEESAFASAAGEGPAGTRVAGAPDPDAPASAPPGSSQAGAIVTETCIDDLAHPSDHEILAHWSESDGPPADRAGAGGRIAGLPAAVNATTAPGPEGTADLGPAGPESTHAETLVGPLDPEFPEKLTEVTDAPTIPGYQIMAVLGSGGMGIVYKAVQRQLKRTVALKMIRGDLSVEPDQLVRFRLEAEAIARLRHPNVVQIYEVGQVGDLPFFSLEMLEGGTLADKLTGAPFTARPAAELTAKLARAVDAVHKVGFIHRDLKPANVLFELDGTPKISDFGLARRLEIADGQTVSGQVMGTPSYMAPEQARGHVHQIGAPADIYALGAVLYEVLTGRPPFKGPNMMETLRQVVFEEVVPPSRLQSRVPRDLETICLKALEKERTRRYATAGEMADDLGRFLDGKTILARPTPSWERALKWARRRPATAAMIAFGLVMIIGLSAGAEWYSAYQRDEVQRHDADIAVTRLKTVDGLELAFKYRADVDDPNHLYKAQATLNGLLPRLEHEPQLDEYRRRVEDALRDVTEKAAVQERFVRFGQLRDQALQLDGNAAFFPDLLQVSSAGDEVDEVQSVNERETPRKQIRDVARAALEVFPLGNRPGGQPPVSLPASLSDEQRNQVEADRYLILMVLSEAVATALPGEDPREQAREALGLLDRAAALRESTAAYHYRRAACLERLEDREGAALEQVKASSRVPADPFDHLLLGREWNMRHDLHKARYHFEESLRLSPKSFWARCWLATADLNSRLPRAAQAKTELTACLDKQPDYPWLYLLRGSAYGQLGLTQRTYAARLPAGSPERGAETAEAETRFENAEDDFRTALKKGLDEGSRYVLLMNRGAMRFQRQQWETAAADFTQAITVYPARYNAYNNLAQVLRKLHRPDEAAAQMSKAIELEPELAALYRGRARARLDRDDLSNIEVGAVLRDFEESARLEPAGSRAAAGDHVSRGQVLLRLGRNEDALAAATAALAVAPGSASAHLVRLRALLETKHYDELFHSCNVALENGQPSADLYRLRGLARADSNDFAGAIDDYTQALALHPADPAEIHRLRGWSHLYASAFELAQRDFDALLQLHPDDSEGHAGRAAARVRLGRVREAVADAEESLRRAAPGHRLLYVAAQTYAQASARAAAEVARRGRPATVNSLAYETRAAELLRQALEQTPADRRRAFWLEVVAQDPTLRTLFHNPRILQWLRSKDGVRL